MAQPVLGCKLLLLNREVTTLWETDIDETWGGLEEVAVELGDDVHPSVTNTYGYH